MGWLAAAPGGPLAVMELEVGNIGTEAVNGPFRVGLHFSLDIRMDRDAASFSGLSCTFDEGLAPKTLGCDGVITVPPESSLGDRRSDDSGL